MFEQATLSYGRPVKRVWTTCLGITGQALLVIGMILTPMIWPEALPMNPTLLAGPLLVPPLPPKGPVVQPKGSQGSRQPIPELTYPILREPTAIPTQVLILDEPDAGPVGSGAPIGIGGQPGSEWGVPGGIFDPTRLPLPPPRIEHVAETPKPPAPSEPTVTRLTVSRLEYARLLHRVEPVYPRIAVEARISGVVELRGVIGVDGHIRELKVLRGHPWLVKAALDAVSQWIYEPTKLNGRTVEVDAPIVVTFRLH